MGKSKTLKPQESALLQRHVAIDGDGNVVGNDNTVQVTNLAAGDYAVQIGEQRITFNVAELRSVLNVENSQVGVIGDHAHVDQIIFQTAAPTNPRERRNRAAMLQLVRNTWIKGVLEQSLHGAAMLELGKDYNPEAVERPWDLEYHLLGQKPRPVPQGTSILEIFDQCSGALLILGEPGSGKTTMLLELGRDLIARAEADETAHIPVVFNLSSWALKQQSLEEWLLDELRTKYHIPKKVAQGWLENDTLLLLLDGLDEVKAEAREKCIAAINAFREQHLVPLAVCSRTADYETLTVKLHLEGAICLRPLTSAQIDAYLAGAGAELQAVRATLLRDPALQELAQFPLMLSIMTLAYRGLNTGALQGLATLGARRQHLFDAYIKRMFQHRIKDPSCSPKQTLDWLAWLAVQITKHQQDNFFIESMQPDWLPDNEQKLVPFLMSLFILPIYALIYGLFYELSYDLVFELRGQRYGFVGALVAALGTILILFILLSAIFSGKHNEWNTVEPIDTLIWSWSQARKGLIGGIVKGLIYGSIAGLVVGLVVGVAYGLFLGLIIGIIFTLLVLLIFGVVIGFTSGFSSEMIDADSRIRPNQSIQKSGKNALIFTAIASLLFGVIGKFVKRPILGIAAGVFLGLNIGLKMGGSAILVHYVLRGVLAYTNRLPFRLVPFLDYCVDRIFLRRVGGGYMFIHPLFQEHFASLTPEDIERLAANADASP